MPNVLQTNINSILAQVASNKNQRDLTKSMEKLSTGKRINKAGDDPAGLAVSTKFVAQIKGSNVAANNSSDATFNDFFAISSADISLSIKTFAAASA